MREIKFRGLEKESNKWVFGYVRHWKCCFGDEWHIQGENDNVHIVISETIGQFTGVLDSNGNEIYEGDIIEENRGYCEKDGVHSDFIFHAVVFWNKSGFRYKGPGIFSDSFNNVKVIGNVHDNPELLERKP